MHCGNQKILGELYPPIFMAHKWDLPTARKKPLSMLSIQHYFKYCFCSSAGPGAMDRQEKQHDFAPVSLQSEKMQLMGKGTAHRHVEENKTLPSWLLSSLKAYRQKEHSQLSQVTENEVFHMVTVSSCKIIQAHFRFSVATFFITITASRDRQLQNHTILSQPTVCQLSCTTVVYIL